MRRQPPISTLLPYTTLFRSLRVLAIIGADVRIDRPVQKNIVIAASQPVHVKRVCVVERQPEIRRIVRHDSDRKSTRLNSSHGYISYAVFCLKQKTQRPNTHALGLANPRPHRRPDPPPAALARRPRRRPHLASYLHLTTLLPVRRERLPHPPR